MKQSNLAMVVLRDGLGRILYWPIWWYSDGLVKTLAFIRGHIFLFNRRIGFTLNWRYLFKPMYGDYSFAGRAISIIFRLMMAIVFTILMFIYLIIMIVLFVLWLVLPLVVVFGLVHQLGLKLVL